MLNENVKKLLKENMWDLATCADGVPNVVPVAFKDVTDDGKLVVGNAGEKRRRMEHRKKFFHKKPSFVENSTDLLI